MSPQHFPATATSVVFEYSLQEDSNSETMTAPSRQLQLKDVHEVCVSVCVCANVHSRLVEETPVLLGCCLQIPGTLEDIFTQLVETYHIPKHQQLPLLFKLRTARYFGDYQLRLKCIEARLQSIAIGSEWRVGQGRGGARKETRVLMVSHTYMRCCFLYNLIFPFLSPASPLSCSAPPVSGSVHSAYSLSPSESLETFLYPGLIEEIVEVLELPDQHLMVGQGLLPNHNHSTSPNHTTQHLTTPHLTTQHLTTPYHTLPHHITPHHTPQHLTTPHHTTQHSAYNVYCVRTPLQFIQPPLLCFSTPLHPSSLPLLPSTPPTHPLYSPPPPLSSPHLPFPSSSPRISRQLHCEL